MKSTESDSDYQNLEQLSSVVLIQGILAENTKVMFAIEQVVPKIAQVVENIVLRMRAGGRLFYMGAGTSGRLGIVDASECPPTFGVDDQTVIGIIAGGDGAIRKAVEFAEDDTEQGWKDLSAYSPSPLDTIVGISASGRTPYVAGVLEKARYAQIYTVGLVCNAQSNIEHIAEDCITVLTGAEFITGSTRMKAGTAQKIVLNMLSTSVMIQLGRVKGNKMVDMQLSNHKLIDRGTKMVVESLSLPYEEAKSLLLRYGSVRKAIENYQK